MEMIGMEEYFAEGLLPRMLEQGSDQYWLKEEDFELVLAGESLCADEWEGTLLTVIIT